MSSAKSTKNVLRFRTAYEPHKPCYFHTEGESLTQQHFQEECDIINIIKRHDRNGIIEHVHRGQARYGDFSEISDYREALDLVQNAQEEFMTIPSDIRKQFDNNPGKFYEFVSNPDNKDELIKMGFIEQSQEAVAPSSATDPIPESVEPPKAQEPKE